MKDLGSTLGNVAGAIVGFLSAPTVSPHYLFVKIFVFVVVVAFFSVSGGLVGEAFTEIIKTIAKKWNGKKRYSTSY